MSLRLRALSPVDQPAFAWSETVRALAEDHRSRRAVDESSRWPLAHACSSGRHAGRVDASAAGVPDVDGTEPIRHAFCCRALA